MQRDDLDERLLRHFAARFPKPDTLDFCVYDVSQDEVDQICRHEAPNEVTGLIETFVSHNRLGMFGDWRDFSPFAGEVAVICRRRSLTLEHDLAFFHLHSSRYGRFDSQDFPLLLEWTEDILMPWRRPIARDDILYWSEHALDYLALCCKLGGDAEFILAENVARSSAIQCPTELMKALKEFLDENEHCDEAKIEQHFDAMAGSWDNQALPGNDFVDRSSVKKVSSAVKLYDGLIAIHGKQT